MSAKTTPAGYLMTLPPAIQSELVDIARTAIGMNVSEKAFAAAMFATVGAHFALNGSDLSIPGAQMVTALGLILRLSDDEANRNEAKVI